MKFARFVVLTFCAFAVFALTMTFAPLMPVWGDRAARAGLLLLFGGLWLFGRGEKLKPYRPLFFAFFTAVAALSLGYYGTDPALARLGLTPQSPIGAATAKAIQASLTVIGILVLAVIAREDLGSLYLRKGRLFLGLAIGTVAAAVCVVLALQQPGVATLGPAKLMALAPWIAIFVITNAVMEELLFRGLFLGRYQPLMGGTLAVFSTALAFTLAHMQVAYSAEMAFFFGVTFGLALLWAWLMLASKSLWGSVLFHAGADVMLILPVFKSLGAL